GGGDGGALAGDAGCHPDPHELESGQRHQRHGGQRRRAPDGGHRPEADRTVLDQVRGEHLGGRTAARGRAPHPRGSGFPRHAPGFRPHRVGLTATVTEHWITVQGLELLVEDQGSGPVVLLAHGMWWVAGMSSALVRDLSRDHRVRVPDLRGHGRSTLPDRQWQIADLATDLAALLDALSVPRVLLGGFSMGGMAAADFALRYPDRLTGLAFMGTSAASEEWIRIAEIRALARLIKLA